MGRSKIYDYSKEDLQDLLDTSNGYADVLRNMGLNPKGGNPKTLKRVIAEYNLDTTKLDKNRSLYFSETGIQLINSDIEILLIYYKKMLVTLQVSYYIDYTKKD